MKTRRMRCAGVAAVISAGATALAGALATAVTAPATAPAAEDAVVRTCVALLLGCTVWAWGAAMAGVAEAWRAPVAPPAPSRGLVRRLVLAACGVAVGAALLTPGAQASTSHPPLDRIAGLPMPERATDGPRHPAPASAAASATTDRVVVHSGDTLWSLAEARLPHATSAADVDAAWRRLYAANRERIGPDPDLVRPGLVLTDPSSHPSTDPSSGPSSDPSDDPSSDQENR